MVVKASLFVALFYFLSPIAMTTLQAKATNNENASRLEFFKAPQVAPIARKVETTPTSKALPMLQAVQNDTVQAAASVQTLCAGLEAAKQPGAFCAAYLPETLITVNDLESSGEYACQSVAPEAFEFETATSLSLNDRAPVGPAVEVAEIAAVVPKQASVDDLKAAQVVADLVRVESYETPSIHQCLDREIDMTEISLLISSITTAMK